MALKKYIIFIFTSILSVFAGYAQSPKDNLLGHYTGLKRVSELGGSTTDCPNTVLNIKPNLTNYPEVVFEDSSCIPSDIFYHYEAFDDSTIRTSFDSTTIYGTLFPNDSLYFFYWDPNGGVIKTEFFVYKQYSFAAPVGIKENDRSKADMVLNYSLVDDACYIQNSASLFSPFDKVEVFDLSGRLLNAKFTFVNSDCIKTDLNSLNQGMYILTLKTKNGFWSDKILVQHQ